MAYRDNQPRTIYLSDYQAPHFLIDKTELTVELGEEETRVRSRLSMRRNPQSAIADAPLELHGVDLEVVSLGIDNEVLAADDYELMDETLHVRRTVPEQFVFSAEVIIRPQRNTSLEGLYKSQRMFCTQCEAEGFRKITFYLDRPDVMSEFTTTIVADREKYPVLLANGNLVESSGMDDGRHRATWHDPHLKPSYLFAMVAGDLVFLEDSFTTMSGRRVVLRIFVEGKDRDKCDFAMTALKDAMAWDEKAYGREYDLDIFMIVAVDDFNMGAMENKGLNIFNSAAVLAKSEITTDAAFQNIQAIVAHEYFHNWSGNRVTCRDWFQLSLKEGFTVFRDSEFSADMGSATVKRVQDVSGLRTLQFAEDAGPMAHPVQPASYMEISNFYTLTVYEKGSEVVRMLQTLLGPAMFRQGADLYFDRHDGQAVTIDDFVAAMADVSGRDLRPFMYWYRQAGTPRVEVRGEYDAAARTYTLEFAQSCRATPECTDKEPYLIPVKMGLVGTNGDLPLFSDGVGVHGESEFVLEITKARQEVVFTDVNEPPVPSLFRGFSAPVKWRFPYDRDDLRFLMAADSDGFNRWDACNQLALDILQEMVAGESEGRAVDPDPRLVAAFREVLADASLDRAMVALLLTLPSEAYLGEEMPVIQVPEIHRARLRARRAVAESLRSELLQCVAAGESTEPYRPEPAQIARRSLKNVALGYLSQLEDSEIVEQLRRQAMDGDNMTDVHAALVALINSPVAQCQAAAGEALAAFYHRWKAEPLAVNLWFQIQAGATTPGGLERVRELLQHEAFDIKNPNKVRSVIGVFCNTNAVNFHRPDGAGYGFLGDKVLELDALNPQVAARQLTPLTRWRKYPPALAEKMKAELTRIVGHPGLSPDVYEVAAKSLAE